MTVAELIAHLQALDQDAVVVGREPGCGCCAYGDYLPIGPPEVVSVFRCHATDVEKYEPSVMDAEGRAEQRLVSVGLDVFSIGT